MPNDVNVITNPIIVYGVVALLLGSIVLALIFARPRRGLGVADRSDAPDRHPGDPPWMPGGDVFGNETAQAAPEGDTPASALSPAPFVPPASPQPYVPPPAAPPLAHDPWSTGASSEPGRQTRWGKR